jgi:hypothetical protein
MKLHNNLNRTINDLILYYKVPASFDCWSVKKSESYCLVSYLTMLQIQFPKIQYFSLPSNKLKNLFGRFYADGLKELRKLNYIERKSLCSQSGMYYSIQNKISASYKLKSNLIKSIKTNEFNLIPVSIKYKPPRPKNGRYSLEETSSNPKVLRTLKAYSGITVDSSWLEYFKTSDKHPATHSKYPNEPIAQHGVFIHSKIIVESILKKKISISSKPKSGRVFHPLICITSGIRKYFRKNRHNLINIDAKSFHPYLIASCIPDKIKREDYLNVVRGGFYEVFADENYSRDKIKVALQKYLSGKATKDSKVLEISRWFEVNFPDVQLKMKELKKKKMTFQMCLQQLESSIFVDEVFMKSEFWSLPMHDGLCVLQKDVDAACEFIGNACESRLGYRIPLASH